MTLSICLNTKYSLAGDMQMFNIRLLENIFLKHKWLIFSDKNILTKYSSVSSLKHLALGTD